MERVSYFFLRIVVLLFQLLPFRALYWLSDGLAFLLHRIIGYRKQVILGNLKQAFPEKEDAELRLIVKDVYSNLADVTLETLKSFTTPVAEIHRRCFPLNPELVRDILQSGRSVILAGSHVNNWEYAALAMPSSFEQPMFGVYKPLSNKVIEKYMTDKRGRGGIAPIPMDEILGILRKQQKNVASYMLIADQSPNSRKRAHWVNFFNRETASLPGTDVLARTFGYPVVGYRIKRVKRGYYEIEFFHLCDDPATAVEGEITERYYRQLEKEIRDAPGNWLWSHKRWKMERG